MPINSGNGPDPEILELFRAELDTHLPVLNGGLLALEKGGVDDAQIEASAEAGAPVVELHTGAYADATASGVARELARIDAAVVRARSLGLVVHAGHGLNYHNVAPIAAMRSIVELNIGHAIVSQALFDGFAQAVAKMKALMVAARA